MSANIPGSSSRHTVFLTQLSHDLSRIADAGHLIRHACRAVGEHLGVHRVYFAEVDESEQTITINGDWAREGTASAVGTYRMAQFGPPELWETARRSRLGIDDVALHPLTKDRLAAFEALRIRAVAFASYAREGQWLVYLGLHERAMRHWLDDEFAVMESVVARVWPLVEQARTEQALRESEAARHIALSAAHLGTYDWDLRTSRVTWNKAQHEIAGTDPSTYEPTLESIWTHVHPDDRARMNELASSALASGGSYDAEYRLVTPDGRVRWCVGSTAVVLDAHSQPVRLSGVTYDITSQKQAEQVLRESRDVLALAMRGGRMGAWSHNTQTDAVWWSRELEEIFGLAPGGFSGTTEGFHEYVHPEDLDAFQNAVATAIKTGGDYVTEFRFRHASGEIRWMEGRGRAVYDDAGHPEMLYGIGIDITERKRAEESLAAARDAAESANRIKDEFMATLSHELRTPLNAILGYARMLRTNALPPEKRMRAIEIIERNAVVQNQLVEDLLDISRIASGKVRLEVEPMLAAAPLQEALESIRPAAEAKRITMGIDTPVLGPVRGDASRLQQIFWNLLSNAVKFTPEGGRVSVSLVETNGAVRVSVQDTGCGISRDFLPYVFKPFLQADGRFSREHGGLGLGLAICKQLVELHGGTISASSEGAGLGARFEVQFPLAADLRHSELLSSIYEDAAQPDGAGPPLVEAAERLDGIDVLVVDDEADTLELFRQALENAGAQVRAVPNAPDAIHQFDVRAPDVLVTDLGLPRVDGYELLRLIRERPPDRGGRVPAISVTAYARLNDRVRALAAGFQAHVAKPVAPDFLVAAVRAATGPRR